MLCCVSVGTRRLPRIAASVRGKIGLSISVRQASSLLTSSLPNCIHNHIANHRSPHPRSFLFLRHQMTSPHVTISCSNESVVSCDDKVIPTIGTQTRQNDFNDRFTTRRVCIAHYNDVVRCLSVRLTGVLCRNSTAYHQAINTGL